MKIVKQISYDEIYQFVTGKKELEKLKKLTDEIPGYGIFSFIQKVNSPLINFNSEVDFTFSDAEEYLEDYFAGTLNVDSATHLSNAIIAGEKNYLKLIYKINENAKAIIAANKRNDTNLPFENHQLIEKISVLSYTNKNVLGNRKYVYGILSAAATLLILFFVPFQIPKDLSHYYTFDDSLPLDYNLSTLRNSDAGEFENLPSYKSFEFKFKQGISEYLVKDYAAALREWDGIENELSELKKEAEYNSEYEDHFYLYKAVSQIALAQSQNVNLSQAQKMELLNNSLKIFKMVKIESDAKKYYYALCLALTGNAIEAEFFLKLIDNKSEFYAKKMILQEQIIE